MSLNFNEAINCYDMQCFMVSGQCHAIEPSNAHRLASSVLVQVCIMYCAIIIMSDTIL